jgi:SSS family solute:Na+ symporter
VETEPITKNVTFMISTIIFQSMGLCMFPLTFQFIFTGRSEDTVRRNQIFMPLYMYMYPFLILTAYYVLITVTGLTNPDEAFMALIARELPPWLVGVVAGGGVLTAILVASLCALSIGGLLTQNIIGMFIPNLSSQKAVYITRFTTAFALLFSAFMAVFLPALMLGVTNFAYYGFTQMFPVTVAAAFWGRATKQGVFAGLLVGLILVFYLVGFQVYIWGINPGLVALLCNAAVIITGSLLTQPDEATLKNHEIFASYNPTVKA